MVEFRQIVAEATALRNAVIPYSSARRVLEATSEYGLVLTQKEYYNTVRQMRFKAIDNRLIEYLLWALNGQDFIHQCRVGIDRSGNRKLL